MLSKHHNKVIRVRHFFAYCHDDYREAENIIPMLDELEPSANIRSWAFVVYKMILVQQVKRMPKYSERQRGMVVFFPGTKI